MSKAEDRALEAYPFSRAYTDNDIEYDGNFCNRLPYIEGYEQAEKDLELSWEDLATIGKLGDDFIKHNHTPMSDEKFYKEVLKRFKDFKERKDK